MGTPYNPSNLSTNCGFCAIAYSLSLYGIKTDADALYLQTIERLGITRVGGHDPIPRLLIFPEPRLDDIPLRAEYAALAEHGRGASSYTITAVASDNNLQCRVAETRRTIANQFLDFYARNGSARWNIDDFVRERMRFLRTNAPSDAVKRHVMTELGGHSIVGSKQVNHFVNMRIDAVGHIWAFDPQDGEEYSGRGLKQGLAQLTSSCNSAACRKPGPPLSEGVVGAGSCRRLDLQVGSEARSLHDPARTKLIA
jgi:hypothetical protein